MEVGTFLKEMKERLSIEIPMLIEDLKQKLSNSGFEIDVIELDLSIPPSMKMVIRKKGGGEK